MIESECPAICSESANKAFYSPFMGPFPELRQLKDVLWSCRRKRSATIPPFPRRTDAFRERGARPSFQVFVKSCHFAVQRQPVRRRCLPSAEWGRGGNSQTRTQAAQWDGGENGENKPRWFGHGRWMKGALRALSSSGRGSVARLRRRL